MTNNGPICKMIVEAIRKENKRVFGTILENKATMLAEILPKIQELESKQLEIMQEAYIRRGYTGITPAQSEFNTTNLQ